MLHATKNGDERKVRIAAIQCAVSESQTAANVAAAADWIAKAADQDCQLAVLPECSLTGYGFDSRAALERVAIRLDGPEVRAILAICAARQIHAIVGFFEARDGKIFNSAALIGPKGIAGVHRKAHLPYLGGDRYADRPEEVSASAFATEIGVIGISICYEIRFPEAMRTLVLNGAEIIALPTNWPVQSSILADHFTRVRAAENMVYFIAANRNDSAAGTDYLGHSQIVDPKGVVMAHLTGETGLITADVDLEIARSKKIVFEEGRFELNLFADRRPEAYRL